MKDEAEVWWELVKDRAEDIAEIAEKLLKNAEKQDAMCMATCLLER